MGREQIIVGGVQYTIRYDAFFSPSLQRSFFWKTTTTTASFPTGTSLFLGSRIRTFSQRQWMQWGSWVFQRTNKSVQFTVKCSSDSQYLSVLCRELTAWDDVLCPIQACWRLWPQCCSLETWASRKSGTQIRPQCLTTLVSPLPNSSEPVMPCCLYIFS